MSFHQTKLRALDYIRSHTLAKGEPPSMREIAYGIGQASPGSVHRLVAVLEAEGKIRRTPGKQRSIEVVSATALIAVELPLELYVQAQAVARKANVTLAEVVIEAVRDGFGHLGRTKLGRVFEKLSRETSGANNGRPQSGSVGQRRAESQPHPGDDGH